MDGLASAILVLVHPPGPQLRPATSAKPGLHWRLPALQAGDPRREQAPGWAGALRLISPHPDQRPLRRETARHLLRPNRNVLPLRRLSRSGGRRFGAGQDHGPAALQPLGEGGDATFTRDRHAPPFLRHLASRRLARTASRMGQGKYRHGYPANGDHPGRDRLTRNRRADGHQHRRTLPAFPWPTRHDRLRPLPPLPQRVRHGRRSQLQTGHELRREALPCRAGVDTPPRADRLGPEDS